MGRTSSRATPQPPDRRLALNHDAIDMPRHGKQADRPQSSCFEVNRCLACRNGTQHVLGSCSGKGGARHASPACRRAFVPAGSLPRRAGTGCHAGRAATAQRSVQGKEQVLGEGAGGGGSGARRKARNRAGAQQPAEREHSNPQNGSTATRRTGAQQPRGCGPSRAAGAGVAGCSCTALRGTTACAPLQKWWWGVPRAISPHK